MQILGLLGMYFDAVVVEVKKIYFYSDWLWPYCVLSCVKTSGKFIQFSVTFSENLNLNKVWFIYIITISKSTPRVL